ncbi:MAG: tRNA lysidine(34) synthetase TilS [Anaerolineae bacterium]|nr:tRNA lysidine(34) synthetase TilS [Anaerolineae bacterium]
MLGVSGGTDSLALAHILAHLAPKLQLQIHIATLNHGLRPEAEGETQVVATFARGVNLPYTIGRVDVLGLQHAEKLTLEEAARKARYDFFAQIAGQIGATTIVTAHHQDDQAETILFHLIRGTGGAGAIGMDVISPAPYHPHLRLVRPLLTTTRAELEAYCHENGLNPVYDPSNDNILITRNAIRHHVLPMLARLNPQITSALARFADIYAEEQNALQIILNDTILPHIRRDGDVFYIPRHLFRGWHVAYQRRLFAQLLTIPNITYDHINHAIQVGMTGENGAIAQFSGGWQLRVLYDDLILENIHTPKIPNQKILLPQNSHIRIQTGIVYNFGAWQLSIDRIPSDDNSRQIVIPKGAQLLIRTRQPKDRFAPLGMNGKHQTVKDWMIHHKIPQDLRAKIPLVVVNDQIAVILWDTNYFVSYHFSPIKNEVLLQNQFFINTKINESG